MREKRKQAAKSQKPTDNSKAKPPTEQRLVATSIAADQQQDSTHCQDQAHNTASQIEPTKTGRLWRAWAFIREPKHSNAVIALFSALTFGTGAVYAVFAAFQLSTMRDANRINIDNNVANQRAYITLSQHLESLPVNDYQTNRFAGFRFYIPVQNSGSTPTKNMRLTWNLYTPDKPMADGFKFPDREGGDRIPGKWLLGPRDTQKAGPIDITPKILQDVKDKKLYLYLYGWATYRDVFKDTPERRTLFCFQMVDFAGNPASPEGIHGAATELCDWHNCADDDCGSEPYGPNRPTMK